MILLDTNVLSATMSASPPGAVLDWLNTQSTETLFLSAVTVAEIAFGIERLADGRRQRDLRARFEAFVNEAFDQRILSFDAPAAIHYGSIMSHRRRIGRPLSALDGQIASIATTRGMAVATRNVRDFEECGVELINPFALES